MRSTATVAVPNAILFVFDPAHPDVSVPDFDPGALLAATGTCLSIGTQLDVDGDTEVTLGNEHPSPGDLSLAGTARIAVASGTLAVETCERRRVASIEVPRGVVALTVWVDHPRFPTRVVIGVDGEGD